MRLLLRLVLCAAAAAAAPGPPRHPTSPRERFTHSVLYEKLGVREAAAARRGAPTAEVDRVEPGRFEPLRFAVVADALADAAKTCQPASLQQKLQADPAQAQGLGNQRCVNGSVDLAASDGLACGVWHAAALPRREAAAACAAAGGHLAGVQDAAVEAALLRHLRQHTASDRFWAGVAVDDAAAAPPQLRFDAPADAAAWSARWNAPAHAAAGLPCCPQLFSTAGDPACILLDGWRELRGLHPYPVASCDERHPYFCQVPPLSVDAVTGEPVAFSTATPAVLYSAQPPPTVQHFDRTTGAAYAAECTEAATLDDTKREVYLAAVRQAVRFVSATLTPVFRGGAPAAAGASFACGHPHFTFAAAARPEADAVVFLGASPDYETAWAFPCAYGSDGRPTAVVLNVAPAHLAAAAARPRGRGKLRARVVAALLRALGFHEALFHAWKQPRVNRTEASASCAAANTNSCRNLAYLATPHVAAFVATSQFRCAGNPAGGSGTLPGAELEDGNLAGGPPGVVVAYWEKRVFRNEIMTLLPPIPEDASDELPVVSGLTLAAFKDMGWYNVNDRMAGGLKWGRNQRCEFASGDCTGWPTRYACDGTATQTALTCSPDFTALGACNHATWPAGVIKKQFRWSTSATEGGTDPLMDFCFVKEPAQVPHASCLLDDEDLPDCQAEVCREWHVRGPSSRCFESTLRYADYEIERGMAAGQSSLAPPLARGTCVPHRCELVAGRWVLSVFVGGATYTCSYKAETVGPSVSAPAAGLLTAANRTLLGSITCPSPEELCSEAGADAVEPCDPVDDCSGNGYCGAGGACVCFSSATHPGPDASRPHWGSLGLFQGAACDACEDGYYGYPICKSKACPVDPASKVMCFGHGVCNGDTGECACHQNATHGYWDAAASCETCAEGYAGGLCAAPSCAATGSEGCGQGACDAATGRCVCFFGAGQGYWGGARCDRCVDGYDRAAGCRARVRAFFACDALRAADPLAAAPAAADCSAARARCEEAGRSGPCRTPARVQETDEFGCLLSPKVPACAAAADGESPGCTGECPVASAVAVDCNGYPLLFATCWAPDACGCFPAAVVACLPGTEAALPPEYRAQVFDADGAADPRAPRDPQTGKTCRCAAVDPAPFDCWGARAAGGGPLYARGEVVYFDPRGYQVVDEDFCHCTSPPVPGCSEETKPYSLPERAYGVPLDCAGIRATSGCPDWDKILNVGRRASADAPDASVIDCGGWPPPRYSQREDPCGCPLPAFRCRPGTAGVCAAGACPKWAAVELDCKGSQPPVSTLRAKHPCGCPPPPKPVCLPGTGACCSCDYPQPETVWVDCRGASLDPPAWHPERVFPQGDPAVQPCDPCPQCVPPPPVRRCLPGYFPRPMPQNGFSRCAASPVDLAACPAHPPACPVDCLGAPPPQATLDDECACPPPPVPACLPGTSGPGSVTDNDLAAMSCQSDPSMCGAYACAPAFDYEAVAVKLGLPRTSFRRCAVKEEVWDAQPGVRYCTQSCATDLDCACGYKCSVCGLCRHHAAPDPALDGNCLLDHGAQCGLYGCALRCDRDIASIVDDLLVDARCRTRCETSDDCRKNAVCTLPTHSAPPRASRAPVGGTSGGRPHSTRASFLAGVPGFNQRATGVGEGGGFELDRDYGECVPAPDAGAARCFSHEECGGYACGRDRGQKFFTASQCLSSCWVDAHCHPAYRCSRAAAACVRGAAEPAAACADDPDARLAMYGGCPGLLARDDALACETDLGAAGYGFPPDTPLRSICPVTCQACAGAPVGGARRAAAALGEEACADDAGGLLVAFGSSPELRCGAVIEALDGCSADIGEFLDAVPGGTSVETLCPKSCLVCSASPGAGDAANGTDVCAAGHWAREGATAEEKCKARRGCCYAAAGGACFACSAVLPNPGERPVPAAALLPADGPGCEAQPFAFCSPYACNGDRRLHPPPRSACPTACSGDDGCQPFHRCVFPTAAELAEEYDTADTPAVNRTTGAATPRARRPRSSAASLEAAPDALRGRCVLAAPAARQGRASVDAEARTGRPQLVVAMGGARGFEEDPNALRFAHAAFAPPPAAAAAADSALSDPAACRPYAVGARGLVRAQLDALAAAAAAGAADAYTGLPAEPPRCKTACRADADCAGGHYCGRGPRRGGCAGAACLGDQAADERPGRGAAAAGRGACLPLRGLGTACAEGTECGSGHCVGGVCCNAACEHPCRTCAALGVCGWVAPRSDPTGGCAACEWCDYEVDAAGRVSPRSTLACVATPFGHDPKDACGAHGACNGEGACAALSPEWGGARADTCSLGFYGPDCAGEAVAYAETVLAEDLKACSASQAAALSQSPATGKTTAPSNTVLKRTASDGLAHVHAPLATTRKVHVVDQRPRQWAQRVLGVRSHSTHGCSNILYEPVPRRDRVHGVSDGAWAPLQYAVLGDGRTVNERLRWSAFVDCAAEATAASCAAVAGCTFSPSGYCHPDGTVDSIAAAESACMERLGCVDANWTAAACVREYPKCRIVVDGAVDVSQVVPPRLEWIELEFASAVFVEAVVLHENSAPGSLVRIETQTVETGSAAMAAAGGGAPETDAAGAVVEKRVVGVAAAAEPAAADGCAPYTEHGAFICGKRVGCEWSEGKRACVPGSKCNAAMEECERLRLKGECFWDVVQGKCEEGQPCRAGVGVEEVEASAAAFCAPLGEGACSNNTRYCAWGARAVHACLPWNASNECGVVATADGCAAQRRGYADDLIPYCAWDAAEGRCAEKASLFGCYQTAHGVVRGEVACNATNSCAWDSETLQCRSSFTAGAEAGCLGYGSRTECISCPYNSDAAGCNAQCSWNIEELPRCTAISTADCEHQDFAACTRSSVCAWRGKPEAEASSARPAQLLSVPAGGGVDPDGIWALFSSLFAPAGRELARNATAGRAAAAAGLPAAGLALGLGGACYLDEATAAARRARAPRDATDYKTYCEGISAKAACLAVTAWETGEADICAWAEDIEMGRATVIPAARVSLYELGTWGGADRHPKLLLNADVAPDYVGPPLTRAALGQVAGNVKCEDLPAGASMNPNANPWDTVWRRDWPNFPLRRRYREWTVPVGHTGKRAKTVRLWFAPTSRGLSQIDAVALVGRYDAEAKCKGSVWVSPVVDGTPRAAHRQRGSVWAAPCGGRGRCGPKGCECLGNFGGEACEACKFGWAGPACAARLRVGCRAVGSEDLSLFENRDEVLSRWRIADYEYFASNVVKYKHFGTSLTGPKYELGEHSHLKVDVGIFIVDVPRSGGNCGIQVLASKDHSAAIRQVIFTRACDYYTGLNVVGREKGDLVDYFTVTRYWPYDTVVFTVGSWAGNGRKAPRLTVTDLLVQRYACW
ncbi:Leishmanolysin-like peptidase [Diplonema papillatum]|nr:Leishmanolysin-like peptidase [Diplonema papillatum]KAJ9441660.1 Leishmanolysin-like peptidase [Diplonema papillatum]